MDGGRADFRGRGPVTLFTISVVGGTIALLALLCAGWLPRSGFAADQPPPPEPARTVQSVTIAAVPGGIGIERLDRLRPAAIGLLNPGLGDVSAAQTWLDVTQGARAFDSDYDRPLGPVFAGTDRVEGWPRIVARARSVTLPIRPGLLTTTLERAGLRAGATPKAGLSAIVAADRAGRLERTGADCPGQHCPFALNVTSTSLDGAVHLARNRAPDELLIVVENPPARSGGQLAIAIAGPGFRGLLRSPSTRTPGYVLSTDIAPTVLHRLGLAVPAAMTGQDLAAGGKVDLPRLEEMEGRYQQVGKRRGAALAVPLLLWIGLAAAVILVRRRSAGSVLQLLCLSVVLLPAALLLTAALEPSLAVERAIATLLPPAVAAAAIRVLPGYSALAAACGVTVVAYGVDMLAGSVLTPRAVIGPNPGLGARFYGIGNELESTLMILTSVGIGAGLTELRRAREASASRRAANASARMGPLDRQRSAAVFLVGGALATLVFAAGRFGADAGAAIVFPVAAVVAAALALRRPRLAWLASLAAVGGLVLIGLIDLATGGQTHFVRSVVGSGAGEGFGEVLRHRLEATGESFVRISRLPITLAALALIAVAAWKRDAVAGWLRPVPLLTAGIVAAAVGSVVGALTNDSGVLFIQVGVLYLGLALGYVGGRERL